MNRLIATACTSGLVLGAIVGLCHCSPSMPTPAQEANLAVYESALQACIALAKLEDSGYYTYKACADGVTVYFMAQSSLDAGTGVDR